MKKFGLFVKILCVVLALTMFSATLVSCGGVGEPLLTLGDSSISVNVYKLYLSRLKATICLSGYGDSALKPEFWENLYSPAERKTYNDYYSELTLNEMKTVLAILDTFDTLGLELPQSKIDAIETKIQGLIDADANGSLNTFNSILSKYGANYDVLREAYIIQEKIKYTKEHLFGENGSKVNSTLVDEYYKENYVRFRQILLKSYENRYETDEYGDKIYYVTGSSKISYDTTKTAKQKEDGSYEADKNGDRIYYYTDEDGNEHIAYKKDGAETRYVYDDDNNPIMDEFTPEQMKILNSDADAIIAEVKEGDTVGFDALVDVYNQDDTNKTYPNGHYVHRELDYDVAEVIDKAMELEIGEITKVSSDYGIHIIMRYELQDKGYMIEGNETFFISKNTGTYSFMSNLVDQLMYDYVKDSIAKIEVDTDLLADAKIKNVEANFYY